MKTLQNYQDGFAFMSGELNVAKRKINNIVKFNINRDVTPEIGDVIHGGNYGQTISQYEITEIIESRPSNMAGKNYVTARTIHSFKNIAE